MTPLKQLPSPLMLWARAHLQRRFALLGGAVMVCLSGLFLVGVVTAYRADILHHHARAARHVTELLRASLENAMLTRDIDGLAQIVTDLRRQPGISDVRILGPTGEIRFSARPDEALQRLRDPALLPAVQSLEQQVSFRTIEGRDVLRAVTPVANQDRCAGCHGPVDQTPVNGLVVLDYEATGLRARMLRGMGLLGALGVVVTGATLALAWVWLDRVVMRRLTPLQAAARQITAGDLTARARLDGHDEIARVGQGFDTMAARLQHSVAELGASHAFLQALIDAIPDGVRVIGPDFRILMANRAYRTQLGLGPDDAVLGQPCHLSSHGRAQPCVPTLVQCPLEALRHGDRQWIKCSHTHRTAQGADLPVEVVAARAVMRVAGTDQPCVIESIRDLNTSVAISQEQRLAEMTILAAGVAHEVYNPLSSIALVLDALDAQPLDSEGHACLRLARAEIAACMAVTDSLLRLTAAPAGRELVDPGAVIRETMGLMRLQAEQAGVTVAIDTDDTLRVVARDSDLRTLVFNLAQNAIHAMPQGGGLRLRCHAAEGEVVIGVTDTGTGIPAADLARIMLPFWTRRADGSRGRGLGLSICKSIVSDLGGTLDVTSAPGRGSTFTVRLPAAPQPGGDPA